MLYARGCNFGEYKKMITYVYATVAVKVPVITDNANFEDQAYGKALNILKARLGNLLLEVRDEDAVPEYIELENPDFLSSD